MTFNTLLFRQTRQWTQFACETFPVLEHVIFGFISFSGLQEQLLLFLNHFIIIIPTLLLFTNANQLEKHWEHFSQSICMVCAFLLLTRTWLYYLGNKADGILNVDEVMSQDDWEKYLEFDQSYIELCANSHYVSKVQPFFCKLKLANLLRLL